MVPQGQELTALMAALVKKPRICIHLPVNNQVNEKSILTCAHDIRRRSPALHSELVSFLFTCMLSLDLCTGVRREISRAKAQVQIAEVYQLLEPVFGVFHVNRQYQQILIAQV